MTNAVACHPGTLLTVQLIVVGALGVGLGFIYYAVKDWRWAHAERARTQKYLDEAFALLNTMEQAAGRPLSTREHDGNHHVGQ